MSKDISQEKLVLHLKDMIKEAIRFRGKAKDFADRDGVMVHNEVIMHLEGLIDNIIHHDLAIYVDEAVK